MGSGQSSPSPQPQEKRTDVLTIHAAPSPEKMDDSIDTTIPKLDTSSWSDDEAVNEDLTDIEDLRRDLDSALQYSPKREPNSAKSVSHRSAHSKDSRFLLDSVEGHHEKKDFVMERMDFLVEKRGFSDEKCDFPETYAQKIQRVQLEDQQPAMLVTDHVVVRRDAADWELEEEQILDFDIAKFKAVNKTEDSDVSDPNSPQHTSTPRSNRKVQYDRFEEEIMAAIERDF